MAWLAALIGPVTTAVWAFVNRREIAWLIGIWRAIKNLFRAINNKDLDPRLADEKERKRWFRWRARRGDN